MIMLAATVAVIAWGALAFGSVYPWAFTPLLAACALLGLLGLAVYRSRPVSRSTRVAFLALVAVLAGALIQLIPLPVSALRTLSPSADTFLANYDLRYAVGVAGEGARPWHPLSLSPAATWIGIAFLASFTLFLAGLTRALSSSRARRLAVLIVMFGVVLALVGIVQKVMLGDHAWAGMKIYGFWTPENLLSTPFGPYINKNHFAGWMLMALPLALGVAMGRAEHAVKHARGLRSVLLWLSSPEGGRLQLALLAIFLMGASLLMTKSRSGVACLAVTIVLMSVAVQRRFGSMRAGWTAFASLGFLFLIVFAMAGADLAARITNRIDAMELRKNIWTDSATIIRDFPLAGTGLNTFGTAMIGYQTSQADQHFQEAHNDYLQVAVEGGLLVALPALAAALLMIRAIRRRFAIGDDDTQTHWVRVGATVGLATIATQAAVEFSLQMPGNAALFVVLLAIALHEPTRRQSPRNATTLGR
jgi:O-antigen ligase